MMFIREYPAWYRLGLHRINDSWSLWIKSPFEIHSFFEYYIEPKQISPMNPCGEIRLGKTELCTLRVGRMIESPFSLTDFTELYEIGPWEAEHPLARAIFQFAMEPQSLLGA